MIRAIRENKPATGAETSATTSPTSKPQVRQEVDPVTGNIKLIRVNPANTKPTPKPTDKPKETANTPTEVQLTLPQIDPVLTSIMEQHPEMRKYFKGS